MNKRAMQVIIVIAIILTISLAAMDLSDLNFFEGNKGNTDRAYLIIILLTFKVGFYFHAISKKTVDSNSENKCDF
ncbi:MAG: hypothetical protein AB8H03_09965 [Saprospiraceae bacterium]